MAKGTWGSARRMEDEKRLEGRTEEDSTQASSARKDCIGTGGFEERRMERRGRCIGRRRAQQFTEDTRMERKEMSLESLEQMQQERQYHHTRTQDLWGCKG